MSDDQRLIVPEGADRMIRQGPALVRAIEALEAIEPADDSERARARLLVKTYKLRLRGIIGTAPTWIGNRIFTASESIPDPAAALFGDN
jgi:hypothetical protein